MTPTLSAYAPDGIGEVAEGDDLATHLLGRAQPADGDIVAVTSKVVSKAEGRVRTSTRDAELPGETVRVVARRGRTTITRTRLGLTMAAAGIDASNVAPGQVVLHPVDPDSSARRLRAAILERTGHNVGVVVTDTAGRAWRDGQTDIAIGAAGLEVLERFGGRTDGYGNALHVTAPAVIDELASLAELASGKLGGRPFVVVTGRADLVLPPQDDGPGAAALVRAEGTDFFGYGAREAVVRALRGRPEDQPPFGSPAEPAELRAAIHAATGLATHVDLASPVPQVVVPLGGGDPRLPVLAYAHAWAPLSGSATRFTPLTT